MNINDHEISVKFISITYAFGFYYEFSKDEMS